MYITKKFNVYSKFVQRIYSYFHKLLEIRTDKKKKPGCYSKLDDGGSFCYSTETLQCLYIAFFLVKLRIAPPSSTAPVRSHSSLTHTSVLLVLGLSILAIFFFLRIDSPSFFFLDGLTLHLSGGSAF